MRTYDKELAQLRAGVNCATLLENLSPGWTLDRKQSTRHSLKYRRGSEILIINLDGRGWWDPLGDAKGDVFNLVQHLDRGLNFGQVLQVLRRLVGVAPLHPPFVRSHRHREPALPPHTRWNARPRLSRGTAAWRYLTDTRALPATILLAAAAADVVREGRHGSAWFAHRDTAGHVTHVEIRGPQFKGSLKGGTKRLFKLSDGATPVTRLVLTEAPIDALSLAAWEGMRADTLYAATGGGMGSETVRAVERILRFLADNPRSMIASATDADDAGDRYAAHHEQLARVAGVTFQRLRPPIAGRDWNDTLKTARAGGNAASRQSEATRR